MLSHTHGGLECTASFISFTRKQPFKAFKTPCFATSQIAFKEFRTQIEYVIHFCLRFREFRIVNVGETPANSRKIFKSKIIA